MHGRRTRGGEVFGDRWRRDRDALREKLLLCGHVGDIAAARETQVCLLIGREEAVTEPAEDIVDDRLRHPDLGIAGPAGRLEAHVTELLDKVRERNAVLEQERDARREGV